MRKLSFEEGVNNLFCKLGWHRPLKHHNLSFVDVISNKTVYNAECPCGLKWSVNSIAGLGGHKVLRMNQPNCEKTRCGFCEKRKKKNKLTCLNNKVISDLFVCNNSESCKRDRQNVLRQGGGKTIEGF